MCFYTLGYGRVFKLAGRSFPWNSHLRGRKVNFAADDVKQSCNIATAALPPLLSSVTAILFSGERLAKNAKATAAAATTTVVPMPQITLSP